jgi:PIN domain nuclease of toxin-antitoxin system
VALRLLLDTHSLIWALEAPERLSTAVREAFDRPSVTVFVSAASTWEIAIKVALGRLRFPLAELTAALADAAFEELPVRIADGLEMARLPLLHRDPFDRLLIAQARHQRLTLVTCDAAICRYPVDTLWD